MTSIEDCGIWRCGCPSNDFAAASCDSACTTEYNMMSFLVSDVPRVLTGLVLPAPAVRGMEPVMRGDVGNAHLGRDSGRLEPRRHVDGYRHPQERIGKATARGVWFARTAATEIAD